MFILKTARWSLPFHRGHDDYLAQVLETQGRGELGASPPDSKLHASPEQLRQL